MKKLFISSFIFFILIIISGVTTVIVILNINQNKKTNMVVYNDIIDDKIFVIAKDEEIKNKDKLIKKAIKFLYSYKGKKANTIIDPIFYGKEEAIKLINEANKAFSPNNSLKSF